VINLKIVYLASEVYPFFKTGGLAGMGSKTGKPWGCI